MVFTQYKIAIIGQGVMGLTCASKLQDKGYSVDIYSKDNFNQTTSMSAGAYWWPHRTYPEEKVSRWAKETYDEYVKYKETAKAGINFGEHFRFCLDPDDSIYALDIVDKWEKIDGKKYGVQCQEAYRLVVPVIDIPVFMPYLKNLVEKSGVNIYLKELSSPAELFPNYDLVVNCTGVWAHHFVNDDEVFPIRGQVVTVSLPENLRESTRLYQKEDKFTLILPRTNDVILGGTAQEGNWDLTPNDEDTKVILERCSKLIPKISKAEILSTSVGLRPGRKEVRLELEEIRINQPVVHNYGHGGGGYTVAWGCANEVSKIIEDYFTKKHKK